jgi:ABC-2 type transport system ATP-binding protein
LHKPEVLLLDEPSLGLDVQVRRDVWNHILQLREQEITIFLCTNYMDEADTLCDRLSILHRGTIAVTGKPRDLKSGIQQDSISIEVGDDGERSILLGRLEEAFQGLPFVKRAKRNGTKMEVSVDQNETALPRLLEITRASHVAVKAVSYSRPGLEDVFLHYTGTGFQEAQKATGGK